jgi:hypothetical protein
MNDLPGALEVLSSRVDELEKRVHALEHPYESKRPAAEMPASSPVALAADESEAEQASGVFAVLGKGLLGIAGAYLFRAVAASGSLPKLAVAAVAIAYAMAWLVWAAWLRGSGNLVRVIYAGASAVILAPMLWELTLHFGTLSPSAASAVLGVYGLIAALLDWRCNVAQVKWIAHGTAALAALSLGIATHSLLPFIATLLLLTALNEYEAVRDLGASVQPLVVLASDVAIWSLIFIYSGPQSARADFPNLETAALIAPAWVLWAISAMGLTAKTVFRQKPISVFGAFQAMLAFGLAVAAVMLFAPSKATTGLGVVCLLLAAASYIAVFHRLRPSGGRRNVLIFGSWSAALTLAGVIWLLPAGLAAICLSAGALAAIIFGGRLRCVLLEFHGLVFLIAAAVISRSPLYAFGELAGSLPARPGFSLIAAAVCATLFYAASKERPGEEWQQQVLHLIPALLAAFALSALLVQGLLLLAGSVLHLEVHHLAFIRTLTLCVVSAAFAVGGSRLARVEMTRIAYAILAFVAAKLLFEDLRHGRMEFIAGSIFLFALALIAVPRLARAKAAKRRVAHQEEPVLQKHV